ncbi:rhodanese-like domain-containing protein [Rhodobacteraceae bacterium CCMM004]|nr:rhodanese-like domain-containing protein [Rhodobacteraceae bacterium CCMM004]
MTPRWSRRFVLAGLAALAAPTVRAEGRAIVSAAEAAAGLAADDMVVIDIRAPQEWAETGVAQGAWPVSMHTPDFAPRLRAALDLAGGRTVALICATGGRTAYVQDILTRNGVPGVADVSEGMLGSGRGPGWIAAGLPVVDADAAVEALPQELR